MGRALAAGSRILAHPLFIRFAGLVLGAVFVYASLDKIVHPDRFADIVHDYQMLPPLLINAFALAMPWVEMTAGAALIVGVWRRGAGLLATALSFAFLIALTQAAIRGLNIECGCFDVSGASHSRAGWGLVVRDVPLLLGAALVWRRG
jgi:uncharacterized membrane protein YphA (DoxX/SURF4 family)